MEGIPGTAGAFSVTWVDVAIVLVLLSGVVIGLTQGFVRQVLVMLALYAALVLSAQYYPYVARVLAQWFGGETSTRSVLALGGLFVFFSIILNWLGWFIYHHEEALPSLDWVDRLAGAGLGVVMGWAVSGFALTVLAFAMEVYWQTWETDRLALAHTLDSSPLATLVSSLLPYLYVTVRVWLPFGMPGPFTS